MQSWRRHSGDCGSVQRQEQMVLPGSGLKNNWSQSISWDRSRAQPRNCWSNLISLRKFTSARGTIAAGYSWIAARITAAVGVICAIAATAPKFAGTENVTSESRELNKGGFNRSKQREQRKTGMNEEWEL